jgi:hypothetical protein
MMASPVIRPTFAMRRAKANVHLLLGALSRLFRTLPLIPHILLCIGMSPSTHLWTLGIFPR